MNRNELAPPYSSQLEIDVICMLINCQTKEDQMKCKDLIERAGGEKIFYDYINKEIYIQFKNIDRDTIIITPASFSTIENLGNDIYKMLRIGKKMYSINEFISILSELNRLSTIRDVVKTTNETSENCYDRETEPLAIIDECIEKLENIRDRKIAENENENVIENIISQFKSNFEKGDKANNVVKYNIPFLDDRYYHERGQTHLIGATPGTGKTAMGLTIFLSCLQQGKTCLFFVKESSAEELFTRLVSMLSNVEYKRIRQGEKKLTENENKRVNKAIEILEKHKSNFTIYGNNSYNHSVIGIKNKLDQEIKKKQQIDLIVIDYIQNMESPIAMGKKATHEVIGYNMEQCNKIFQKYNCAGIVLSQLNRELDGKPRLSNLKGSSVLEQEAHIITFLHRKSVLVIDGQYVEVEMYCEKQRLGELFENVQLALKVPEAMFIEKPKYSKEYSEMIRNNI
jgi:replicative DNA helicase